MFFLFLSILLVAASSTVPTQDSFRKYLSSKLPGGWASKLASKLQQLLGGEPAITYKNCLFFALAYVVKDDKKYGFLGLFRNWFLISEDEINLGLVKDSLEEQAELCKNEAFIAKSEKRLAQAVTNFQQAAETFEKLNVCSAWVRAAKCYEEGATVLKLLGNIELAIEFLERSILQLKRDKSTWPMAVKTYLELATLYVSPDRIDQASEFNLLEAENVYSRAVLLLERITKESRNNSESRRARIFVKLGNFAKAKKDWEELLKVTAKKQHISYSEKVIVLESYLSLCCCAVMENSDDDDDGVLIMAISEALASSSPAILESRERQFMKSYCLALRESNPEATQRVLTRYDGMLSEWQKIVLLGGENIR